MNFQEFYTHGKGRRFRIVLYASLTKREVKMTSMSSLTNLASIVRMVDSSIHRMNLYPLDSAIGFPKAYSLGSDLSGNLRYPSFEQQGPGQ